jgi:hypothetical protein
VTCAELIVLGALTLSCSSPKPAPTPARSPELWGDMKPVVSVKELMHDLIDPLSDNIFEAVKYDVDSKGTIETQPRTDEDWDKVRVGAVAMAEGVYLLKVRRPFTPPGDNNNSAGPDFWELSPDQITAKVAADPVLWDAKIEALRNVGLEVLEIVKKKDVKALFEAGEDLDQACENCHIEYWYPSEKALMPKLDRRLEELYGLKALHPDRTRSLGMEPKKR